MLEIRIFFNALKLLDLRDFVHLSLGLKNKNLLGVLLQRPEHVLNLLLSRFQGCYASARREHSEKFGAKWCYVTNILKFGAMFTLFYS